MNALTVEKKQKKTKKKNSLARDFLQLILKILFIFVCVFAVFTFLYGIVRTEDISMYPAIKDGDLVVYYRLDKLFYAGDVAVVQYKGRTSTGRIVAVAGDTVDITKEGVMINGALLLSEDIYYDTTQFENGVDFPLMVEEGQVFLLGDNRPSATDSRIYGCVNISDIKGKAIAVIRTRGI